MGFKQMVRSFDFSKSNFTIAVSLRLHEYYNEFNYPCDLKEHVELTEQEFYKRFL
jgi:hypothetical protein